MFNSINVLLDTERQRIEEVKQWFEGLPDFDKGLFGELSDVEKAQYAEQANVLLNPERITSTDF